MSAPPENEPAANVIENGSGVTVETEREKSLRHYRFTVEVNILIEDDTNCRQCSNIGEQFVMNGCTKKWNEANNDHI